MEREGNMKMGEDLDRGGHMEMGGHMVWKWRARGFRWA